MSMPLSAPLQHIGWVDAAKLTPRAGDDAAAVGWHFADAPPTLAFDHAKILTITRQEFKI